MLKKHLRYQHHNLLSFKKHFSNVAQEALQQRGPNTLDGIPLKGTSGTNECPVPECVLPGGHGGHHRDDKDEPCTTPTKDVAGQLFKLFRRITS